MQTLLRFAASVCVVSALGSFISTHAQNPSAPSSAAAVRQTPDSLFQTVAALDTRLFDAYNHCDLATIGDLVSDDLEFYHDKTGLAVGKKPFIDAIQQNICGKVERTLVAGSLEVYPL